MCLGWSGFVHAGDGGRGDFGSGDDELRLGKLEGCRFDVCAFQFAGAANSLLQEMIQIVDASVIVLILDLGGVGEDVCSRAQSNFA